jgi:hypothetical protein
MITRSAASSLAISTMPPAGAPSTQMRRTGEYVDSTTTIGRLQWPVQCQAEVPGDDADTPRWLALDIMRGNFDACPS